MINHWRKIRYTDDGCDLYQCLQCYAQWEGRSAPGYHYPEGVYHVNWRFCPYCGTEWNGPLGEETYGNERMLGPRRLRREQLMRQAYDAWNEQQYDFNRPSWEREAIPRYDERHITHWWSLQRRSFVDFENKTPGPVIVKYEGIVHEDASGGDPRLGTNWETCCAWKGGMMPTRKAWFFVKEEIKRQEEEHSEPDFYQRGVFLRLLVTRHRPRSYIVENYDMENVP